MTAQPMLNSPRVHVTHGDTKDAKFILPGMPVGGSVAQGLGRRVRDREGFPYSIRICDRGEPIAGFGGIASGPP